MAVFREMTIAWKGKDYTLTPSMRLMRSIEMGDISFTDIAIRTSRGRPPISHISYVLAKMLQAAGATVGEEEVYAELMSSDQETATGLIGAVLTAFSPGEGNSKNPGAPSESPTPRATENAGH